VSPELCLDFHYFATRKLLFLQRATALVAFPGGFGDFDELFDTNMQGEPNADRPCRRGILAASREPGFPRRGKSIDAEDRDLFWYAETPEEIRDGIQDWERACAARYGAELRRRRR
jgi:predicted Rossmann-fold nucleotide-binding protein